MNSREEGFLLLSGHLGQPARRPLTTAQLRELSRCALRSTQPKEDRELDVKDLIAMGCSYDTADKVVSLLGDQDLLHCYLELGHANGCVPLTRVSPGYPLKLRQCLGDDSPAVVWCKGEVSLLNRPAVALVGSRDLMAHNAEFARQVGKMSAQYGFVLISGNARGADSVAQESCLAAGGTVISVVADSLLRQAPRQGVLYLSEEGFDLPFNGTRALSRNRLIHSMAVSTFVAQCSNGSGGTWDGTCRNLRGQWSTVYCFPDGSVGITRLYQKGARLVKMIDLRLIFEKLSEEFG